MPTNVQTTSSAIVINRTLRNTYQLLSATLLFSGLMAYLSMYLRLPYFGLLITLGGYFGLLSLKFVLVQINSLKSICFSMTAIIHFSAI